MDKNKFTVDIFGERYALKGSMDEKKVRELAKMLDEEMRNVARVNPRLPAGKVAVLAALNLCDAYKRLEADYHQLLEMIHDV